LFERGAFPMFRTAAKRSAKASSPASGLAVVVGVFCDESTGVLHGMIRTTGGGRTVVNVSEKSTRVCFRGKTNGGGGGGVLSCET